jgi:hypothetical protein
VEEEEDCGCASSFVCTHHAVSGRCTMFRPGRNRYAPGDIESGRSAAIRTLRMGRASATRRRAESAPGYAGLAPGYAEVDNPRKGARGYAERA